MPSSRHTSPPVRGFVRPPSMLWGLPLLIMVSCLLLWPLGVIAVRSMRSDDGFTLGRYGDVLTSSNYLESFLITSVLAIGSTVIALLLCVPAALYLERTRTRTSRAISVGLTIPLSLPGIVIGFFVILLFGTTGLFPVTADQLFGSPIGQIAYTFTGLLIGYLYFNIPRVILVVRGAVAQVSTESIDAARTLGASAAHVYARVVLPALRPAVASASALSLATAFGAFGTAATLSRGYRVVPLDIAASFTERFDPQLAATLSVLLALITTGILVGVNKLGEAKRA
ncbi:ABC transporter permease [Phytoactinopolyspora alkaliphila]|nr:ABC transporter permease subunit [Phytoactinopolyspora alkaliphila]